MKANALLSLMVLALIAAGCVSHRETEQRGWIGGSFLVAKNPSWTGSGQRNRIVPAFPRELEPKQKTGVFVSAVYSNTPLAHADICAGDLILQVNQEPVEDLATFHAIIDHARPGSSIPLTIFHADHTEDRLVTIGRESYKNWRTIGIGLPGRLELDLIPNPDFSLIALNYYRSSQRLELHSPQTEFVDRIGSRNHKGFHAHSGGLSPEGWNFWLAIFSLGSQKQILSQQIVEPKEMSLITP